MLVSIINTLKLIALIGWYAILVVLAFAALIGLIKLVIGMIF